MSQLDQLPAGAVVRARPWDVIGAGLAAPMVLWGFLGWFGTVGDSGGGMPGFYSGTGAAGIALVLAAAALTANQLLAGRPHERSSPPVSVFLAAAAAVVILGGMVAKPDSATIQAGSVAGLLTALSQGLVLIRGWLQGSQKSVRAANVRALNERQAAADLAAVAGQPGRGWPPGSYQPTNYGGWPATTGSYPAQSSPQGPGYPHAPGYPQGPSGYPPGPGYPPAGYPAAGGYPPPPAPHYPQFPPRSYPPGQPPGQGYPPGPPRYPAGPPPGHPGGPPQQPSR
jgi:hypothetical protein